MTQPLFDFDLKRASRENYITGKAAINFPHPGSPPGGWHSLSYFDRKPWMSAAYTSVFFHSG
jgi:hypothetical protein